MPALQPRYSAETAEKSAVLARRPLALVRVEVTLTQANALRSNLDQLIILDVGDRLFEGHPARRGEANGIILAGGAEVGELLGLERVHLQVLRLGVFADNHAFVELLARADEQYAAIFQGVEGVGDGFALLHRDQHAVLAALDRAFVGTVFLE